MEKLSMLTRPFENARITILKTHEKPMLWCLLCVCELPDG